MIMYMFDIDNDYHKAKKQLQYCEDNSDIPSDIDALQKLKESQTSRSRKRPCRYDDTENDTATSDSKDNEKEENPSNSRIAKKSYRSHSLPRPPLISSGN